MINLIVISDLVFDNGNAKRGRWRFCWQRRDIRGEGRSSFPDVISISIYWCCCCWVGHLDFNRSWPRSWPEAIMLWLTRSVTPRIGPEPVVGGHRLAVLTAAAATCFLPFSGRGQSQWGFARFSVGHRRLGSNLTASFGQESQWTRFCVQLKREQKKNN